MKMVFNLLNKENRLPFRKVLVTLMYMVSYVCLETKQPWSETFFFYLMLDLRVISSDQNKWDTLYSNRSLKNMKLLCRQSFFFCRMPNSNVVQNFSCTYWHWQQWYANLWLNWIYCLIIKLHYLSVEVCAIGDVWASLRILQTLP